VRLFKDGKRKRRLSDQEYPLLGAALRKAGATTEIWPPAVAAAQFLALTGWRPSEVLNLRKGEFDLSLQTAWLPDSKTDKTIRPLSRAACDVLRKALKHSGDELVFPASRGNGDVVMRGFKRPLRRMGKLGGLPADVTPNVLRHSFASVGADLQFSDPVIGLIIGHKKPGATVTSSVYARAADPVLIASADAIANRVAALMAGNVTVVPLPQRAQRRLVKNIFQRPPKITQCG
jgi:integrase